MVTDTIISVDDELALGATREIEASGGDVVEPLIVSAECDVILEVVFDRRIVDRVSKLVDFFDFDCAWCHVAGRVWAD